MTRLLNMRWLVKLTLFHSIAYLVCLHDLHSILVIQVVQNVICKNNILQQHFTCNQIRCRFFFCSYSYSSPSLSLSRAINLLMRLFSTAIKLFNCRKMTHMMTHLIWFVFVDHWNEIWWIQIGFEFVFVYLLLFFFSYIHRHIGHNVMRIGSHLL